MPVKKSKIDRDRAEALLSPIAAFLLAGGMTRRTAQESFAAAIEKAQSLAGGRRIDHIGHPTHFADIVGRWAHDKRFVDDRGRPRLLAWSGKNQFTSLVRGIDGTLDPRLVLSVLTRYGNVRKVKGARYALARQFFFTSTHETMAFEPMAYFLADASATLGRILNRAKRSRAPELFWRKVECTELSERAVKSFMAFARDKSLDFLEHLDDWLVARQGVENRRRRSKSFRRVGLGLFTIQSDAEASQAAK